MLEQLLKFKSDVRRGRKEVVFNEICNVSEMRRICFRYEILEAAKEKMKKFLKFFEKHPRKTLLTFQ